MIHHDFDLNTATRGCCPKCGGTKLKNLGYLKIECVAWESEIWIVDGAVKNIFGGITSDDKIYTKDSGYNRTEELNPDLYEVGDDWECEECYHNFRMMEAKAAIMGPSLANLVPDVLE